MIDGDKTDRSRSKIFAAHSSGEVPLGTQGDHAESTLTVSHPKLLAMRSRHSNITTTWVMPAFIIGHPSWLKRMHFAEERE